MFQDNKRRADRKAWNGSVEIYDVEGLLLLGIGRLLNLSESGSLIETALTLRANQAYRLRMRVDADKPMELRITVMHVKEQGTQKRYGIRFDTMMPAQWVRLQTNMGVSQAA